MSDNLPIPGLGLAVDLGREDECALALADVRALESQLREVKGLLTSAIAARMTVLGKGNTLHFENITIELKPGDETEYDAEAIEAGLRAAGMPEERIREIVYETVVYKVRAIEAKRASVSNPAYAKVIRDNSRVIEKPPYVTIRRNR